MTIKTLIADDAPLTLEMVRCALAKKEFYLDFANDGQEALDKINTQEYDLVITDIIMPKVEGIEVINEIVNVAPNTKIIAMTSEGQAGHTCFLTLAKTVGADATLKKPFKLGDLMSAIEKTGLLFPDDSEKSNI